MELVLAILSVLAVWAFLGLLVLGLLFVEKALESIRVSLEHVAMGVRAIEKQTAPLGTGSETVGGRMGEAAHALSTTAGALSDLAPRLATAAADLPRRPEGAR